MKSIPPNISGFLKYLHNTDRIGVFLYDDQLRIMEWSPTMVTFTGLSRDECLGRSVHEVVTPNQQPGKAAFRRAFMGASYVMNAVSLKNEADTDNQKVYDLHFCPLPEQENNVQSVLVLALATDNSQPSNKKYLLSNTRATIDNFLNYAPIPIFIVDAKLNIKLANKAFYTFIEAPAEASKNLRDFIPTHLIDMLQNHINYVIESEQSLIFSEKYQLRRGMRHLYNIIFPVRSPGGKVDAIGGYLIDLTRQAVQLQKNEELLNETLRLNEILNEQNQALQQKQIALDEANKALQEQKDELERVVSELSDRNYELDQIMYKTSHDLRAPLTSILGLLQLAKLEKDITKLPEYHQYMENRVNKLDDFVKTMLTYAKTSRTEISLETINWQQLVQDSLEQVQYLEHYHQIKIETTLNTDLYPFMSDPMRVNIILNNLIGNAIKYANLRRPEPYVKVRINNSTKGSSIEVEDNGIGIPQLYIDKVWDMFFRATDRSEGSGLGLYIVKQTVERLQGRITIESREREGTTIAVFLPHLTKHQRLKTMKPKSQASKKKI